jgi:hypothetical protein
LVQKLKGTADDFILIIKPSPESTFKNFVDIVDEVAINDVKHYYTSETDDEDVNQLIAEPLKTQ